MNNDRGIICLNCGAKFEAQLAISAGNAFICPVCHKDICKESKNETTKEN